MKIISGKIFDTMRFKTIINISVSVMAKWSNSPSWAKLVNIKDCHKRIQ